MHAHRLSRWATTALLAVVACDASTPSTTSDASPPTDAAAPDATLPDGARAADAISDTTLAPDAGPDAALDAAPPSFYGPGIGADSLDNHQVADVDVDFRFRAAVTGSVTSLRWYDIYDAKCAPHSAVDAGTCPQDCPISGNVYACGTGGTMHICIQTDDGSPSHLSTGTDLGCVDHPNASGPPFFPLETFPPAAPQLTAGQLYHLHWHNTDPSPTVNFTSVDTLFVTAPTIPRQPTIPDVDLAVFRGTTLRPADTPIFQLLYADSTAQGQGYMEVWAATAASISGGSVARERFTVSGGDRTVTLAGIRASLVSGTSPLDLALEAGDGTVLEHGSIPAASFPGGSPTWATLTFATPHVLTAAQSYALVLSAPPDTVYQAYALERGTNYSFVPPTFFGDGYGQTSSDDGGTWIGFMQPGGSADSHIADLQLYFR